MNSLTPTIGVGVVFRVLVVILLTTIATATSADQRVRTIERSPTVPISDRLLPDDQMVVIQDFPHPSGLVDEPVTVPQEITWLTDTNDAALVVDVLDVKGQLVDEGLWIHSTIGVRVTDVAMERRPDSREVLRRSALGGQHIDLQWLHGGETTIGPVTIRANPSQLEVGKRYLVFLDRWSGGVWDLSSKFEVQNSGVIRHLFEDDKTRRYDRSPLDGLRLDRVLRDLKREAEHPKAGRK